MAVAGEIVGEVVYEGQRRTVKLVVTVGNSPSLLGRDWLEKVKLNWEIIGRIKMQENRKKKLETLLKENEEIFRDELGTMKNVKAKLTVRHEARPKFFKPRPVPFALKEAVGKELDRLEEKGIIEKVPYSEWAAPIVAVPKPNGAL